MFPYSRYVVASLHEELLIEDIPRIDGVWFHIVLNFFGFSDEEGITVYHDGVQLNNTVKRRTISSANVYTSDRRIILGKSFDDNIVFATNRVYSSVSIDELGFHNHILTDKEIMQMIQ